MNIETTIDVMLERDSIWDNMEKNIVVRYFKKNYDLELEEIEKLIKEKYPEKFI